MSDVAILSRDTTGTKKLSSSLESRKLLNKCHSDLINNSLKLNLRGS